MFMQSALAGRCQPKLLETALCNLRAHNLPLWCKWLTRRPLKAESTGSSPVSGTSYPQWFRRHSLGVTLSEDGAGK